jgi:hypothetical protein
LTLSCVDLDRRPTTKRRKGREATVRRWLDAGATVPNRAGRTPIPRRFRRGRKATVKRVLEAAPGYVLPFAVGIVIVWMVAWMGSYSIKT